MQVRIDSAGRIVIPKPLRTALGIGTDTQLELFSDGAGLRLEPVSGAQRSIDQDGGLPLLGRIDGVVLTDNDVRRLRDESQR